MQTARFLCKKSYAKNRRLFSAISNAIAPNASHSVLSQLAEFAESASIQTIIFAGYSETYPFKQRTKTIQTKNIALYNIEKILPVDKQQIPYCFILHPDLHISELFIPDKSFPEVMKRYMQILKAKYSFIQ